MEAHTTSMQFCKMNGLGNDFIIIDARAHTGFALTPAQVQSLAVRDNETTGGCDQLLIVRPPISSGDIFMEIRNSDGSEVEACGNGTRAIAAYLYHQDARDTQAIATKGGLITTTIENTQQDKTHYVHAHIPPPQFGWRDIPLTQDYENTAEIVLHASLPPAFMVNVGNPHAVIFVEDNANIMAKEYGAALERHELFSNKANINFATLIKEDIIRLHTWERGAGLTKACGTGATAAAIAAIELGKTSTTAIDILPPSHSAATPDNYLHIDYTTRNAPIVSGHVQFDFAGALSL